MCTAGIIASDMCALARVWWALFSAALAIPSFLNRDIPNTGQNTKKKNLHTVTVLGYRVMDLPLLPVFTIKGTIMCVNIPLFVV